jgi:hypothetical protein
VLEGVDVRGRNAYVLAPPSLHPSGARYRWIIRGELSPAPAWLVELIAPEKPQRSPRAIPDGSRGTAYGQGALRRELERLGMAQKGTRNHHLYVASRHLGELVGAGVLDEAEVTQRLHETGERLFGPDAEPHEVERTVASGLTAGMAQPRAMTL